MLADLPPRTESLRRVTMSAEEQALYEAVRRQALEAVAREPVPDRKSMLILSHLMKLRRACCAPQLVLPDSPLPSSKLQVLGELLDDLVEGG
ncbi:MAG: SNF2-related protein, partial [Candidatus Xenobia bacterium]